MGKIKGKELVKVRRSFKCKYKYDTCKRGKRRICLVEFQSIAQL